MLPIIISSKNKDETDMVVQSIIADNTIDPLYLNEITPSGTTITIGQIRKVAKESQYARVKPVAYLLRNFETARVEAQNAFLKTLEERNEHMLFILITNNIHAILPTIRSRCVVKELRSAPVAVSSKVQSLFRDIQTGGNTHYFSDLTFQKLTRETAVAFLDESIQYWREYIPQSPAARHIVRYAFEQKQFLLQNNLNPQLCFDSFILCVLRYQTGTKECSKKT